MKDSDQEAEQPRILNGRYRLVYALGAGGMGSVWLAEDQLLERLVALKELILPHAGAAGLPARRARALQEARALARVHHPSIVSIHDVFFIGEFPWIVMEYISGRSLADLIIKEHSLDEPVITRIGVHVLRGLIAAHKAGVVHRDVKPTNILVADDGSIFLVDFGIARIAGDTSLTGQSIVGTPDFLAPERFRTGKVGPPADIWALGVTFYLALEGYSPFWRNSDNGLEATMNAILNDQPRPPAKGGWLADITMRMLEKDPGKRVTAERALAILEQHGERVAQLPPTQTRSTPGPPPDWQSDWQSAPPPGWQSAARPDWRPATPPEPRPQPRLGAQPQQSPGAQPMPPAPVNRGRQAGDARVAEVRELITSVGIDTGVAILLGMGEGDAARVLTDCRADLCGDLLQGIAAARPASAAAILRIMRASSAGRAFAYLRPATAAALLAVMQRQDALRLLEGADERSAAAAIMELPVPTAADLLKSMHSTQRAARVLTHVRPVTAAELIGRDTEFAAGVLRHLSTPVRKQVTRHMAAGPQNWNGA